MGTFITHLCIGKRAKAGVEQQSERAVRTARSDGPFERVVCIGLYSLSGDRRQFNATVSSGVAFTSNAPETVCRPDSGPAGGAYNAPSHCSWI